MITGAEAYRQSATMRVFAESDLACELAVVEDPEAPALRCAPGRMRAYRAGEWVAVSLRLVAGSEGATH